MEDKILGVLRELENIKGRESLFWNVPRTTAEFLNMLTGISGARKVLEIGTSNGYSGIFIAEGLSHTGGLLYTVESNDERFKMAAENFKKAGVEKNVRQIKGHAPEVLAEVLMMVGGEGGDEEVREGANAGGFAGANAGARARAVFDMIFIDATKMEYKSYAEVLIPMLRPGGIIVADNCLSHADEVNEYVSYLKGRGDMSNVLLPFDNGLLLSYKERSSI